MAETRDRGSVFATEEGIQILKDAKAAQRNHNGKSWTYLDIANASGLSNKTVERFFRRRQPTDESSARAICQALEVDYTQVVEIRSSEGVGERCEHEINWRKLCAGLLSHWKGLTTNVLTAGDGVRFQLDDVFIPLGLVERRQRPRHSPISNSSEQGSELYEEKVTPISQDDFFEQVLRQRQSKNSQGKRIAIIGEPGAGKTTQLQKIGDWILKETDEIPIWIPLAAVGTRTLKEYLLHDWLQTATSDLEVSQQYRDELGQLLKTGKVWLLLDGVDEMAASDAIHQISVQMREGWLQNIRVVLTCRLNVWDAGKQALDRFDVYRNLDFDYPNEVYQFIDKCFAAEHELQQKLKVALEQPGKERIRDMIKNPLRLMLLCYSWQLRQGELPETKAGLYEWFVDAFYEWNKGKTLIKLTATKRKELNQALGELAKEAIDRESSRFRLREKFIVQFLGDADDEDSLFQLALQLGWLNRIGVAEENPLENVYAFLHPTFQEYFAALAINNSTYFLPNDQIDQSAEDFLDEDEYYRIFESQWLEVTLLWIGRPDLDEYIKQDFIDRLVSFEDLCVGCYADRAFFLAIELIAEFDEYDFAADLIEQLIDLAFEEHKDSSESKVPDFISETAESLILKTNQNQLFSTISRTHKSKPESVQLEIVELLMDAGKTDHLLIEILERLAVQSKNDTICLSASTKLLDFVKDNITATKVLENLASHCHDDSIRAEAATCLLSNNSQNSISVEVLIELASQKHNILAIEGLSYAHGNAAAIEVLSQIVAETQLSLKDSGDGEEDSEEESDLSSVYWAADESLSQIELKTTSGFPTDVTPTNRPVYSFPDEDCINTEILKDLEETRDYVYGILDLNAEKPRKKERLIDELLEIYLENYRSDENVVLSEEPTQTEREIFLVEKAITRRIEELLDGRDSIIAKVLNTLRLIEDDEIFYDTLSKLEEIGKGNSRALRGVMDLAIKGTRSHRLNVVVYAIGSIGGTNNLESISFMLSTIVTPQKEEIAWIAKDAVESLKEILQDFDLMFSVVAFLSKRIINENLENTPEVFLNCYSVLWYCSQHLSYPYFFNAWCSTLVVQKTQGSLIMRT